ncbi:MAG: aminopeptidase [Methylibium sp.]|uniref:aminopeptidase n=1 Tax=Methylibium sp. TaxID=2067992 RepID=UPI0017EC187F|nr:aminopeptidase [Methylibium sp.]MBA3596597.1 aminopeptidase [Methylibium sp.]
MKRPPLSCRTWAFLGAVSIAGAALVVLGGCSSVGYLSQSVQGHLGVMNAARPVADWLSDAGTPAELRERLLLSQRIRDFAVRELALPDNASYRRYAALDRPAVVWNVVAAPELSLTLKTWCFPVVGCVGYRGYFERAGATALADELRAAGLEAGVYGVPAYSTLGKLPFDYFADPLLSTFIRYPEGELARLIFHELAHQVSYAKNDTEFNESFATAVERLGGARWLQEQADEAARDEYRRYDARRHDFKALALATRKQLEAVYESAASDAEKRRAKADVMARMRAEHQRLKDGPWEGYRGYDAWFANANNASLGVQAAYNALVPAFEALFEAEGRDFPRFYAEVERLAALPKEERRATLAALDPAPPS